MFTGGAVRASVIEKKQQKIKHKGRGLKIGFWTHLEMQGRKRAAHLRKERQKEKTAERERKERGRRQVFWTAAPQDDGIKESSSLTPRSVVDIETPFASCGARSIHTRGAACKARQRFT